MRDLIGALRGGLHCGWCHEQKTTMYEKFMRYDQLLCKAERRWYERVMMKIGDKAGPINCIWRLGRRLHFRFHVSREVADIYYGRNGCQ